MQRVVGAYWLNIHQRGRSPATWPRLFSPLLVSPITLTYLHNLPVSILIQVL
jgi:hypothetical protein